MHKGIPTTAWGGVGGGGRGEPAAGEESQDGYVKKDLFHCRKQNALPKSQLQAGKPERTERGWDVLRRLSAEEAEIKDRAPGKRQVWL